MSDVFVSYKAEDRNRVEPLVEALEADGLSVWWDARIAGGDHWRETILGNLESAKCVIVIWSRRSTGPEGEFVRDEATRAKRRGVYLPVQIDKVEPPLGFGEMQALSLQGWKGDRSNKRYKAVLSAIRGRLGVAAPVSNDDGDRGGVSRRTAIAAGAGVATLAAAGAAGWWYLQLAPAAAGGMVVGGTNNPEAHDLFLKGLAARQSAHGEENLKRAIDLFDQAIALDPKYADAFARKATALCEFVSAFTRSEGEMQRGFIQAAAIADHALTLAPDLPSAHAAFAALERARRVGDPGLVILLTDPFLDAIRSDPRFVEFRRKISFPPETQS
jgi:hypothetical protein